MNAVESGRVRYLSSPTPVSMGNSWYGVSDTSHFWVRRRFEVLRQLSGNFVQQASSIAEIGCGHGLLQRQVEDHYHREVTGFDLNEFALKQTVSRTSPVYCYDVLQKNSEYEARFDVIFLFDVLEHLENEDAFVQAVQFHLAPQGRIFVNVPACQFLWSKYDEGDGHFRRYNLESLQRVAQRNGMRIANWTYWCLPLIPLLLLRKIWTMGQSKEHAVSSGFASRGPLMNRILFGLARCESIPQHLLGSSLMAVLERVHSRRGIQELSEGAAGDGLHRR